MFERILVPVDGSSLSELALKVAVQSMPQGASLTILTVVPKLSLISFSLPDLTSPQGQYQDTVTALFAEATAYVKHLAQNPVYEPHHVGTAVQIGDPAQAIIDTAQKANIDLIVMTTHGRSGFSRWVFGSVAAKVLSAAPCPTLIIPRPYIEQMSEKDYFETFVG